MQTLTLISRCRGTQVWQTAERLAEHCSGSWNHSMIQCSSRIDVKTCTSTKSFSLNIHHRLRMHAQVSLCTTKAYHVNVIPALFSCGAVIPGPGPPRWWSWRRLRRLSRVVAPQFGGRAARGRLVGGTNHLTFHDIDTAMAVAVATAAHAAVVKASWPFPLVARCE